MAASANKAITAALLLDCEADIESVQSGWGEQTALTLAITEGAEETVRLLLGRGIAIDHLCPPTCKRCFITPQDLPPVDRFLFYLERGD